MALDLSNYLIDLTNFPVTIKYVPPDGQTMSFRDILALPDGTEPEMSVHSSDPCPTCGAFNMLAADFMYLGECHHCAFPDGF